MTLKYFPDHPAVDLDAKLAVFLAFFGKFPAKLHFKQRLLEIIGPDRFPLGLQQHSFRFMHRSFSVSTASY